MAKEDRMEFNGEVVDFNNGKFSVKVNDNYFVLAILSGKIRQNGIKILVGDFVTVEVSPYDTKQGRITYRHKA
jgi:translation initiation factor IF-1